MVGSGQFLSDERRGHFLTKSQRYSTTFAALRAKRQRWQLAQQGAVSDVPDEEELEFREWTYEGSGYRTAGDVGLARNMEEGVRDGRMLAREEGGARAKRAVAEMEGEVR